MHTKIGISIHNRFDIELENINTGKIRRGVAENIVLNRMYTQLTNTSAYFSIIHFGQGTGDLSPTRTNLFSSIGYATASLHERIRAYPISKWTQKIILNPEQYVGKTFTEVGISETSSYINTHALIKDSEGNPISLTKTDVDILTIYATVFIEISDVNENIRLSNIPNSNELINYLTGVGGFGTYDRVIFTSPNYTKSRYLDISELQLNEKSAYPSNHVVITRSAIDRTLTFSTRFNPPDSNMPVRTIGLKKVYSVTLPEPTVFGPYVLDNVYIGEGDGVTTEFNIPHLKITDEDIKKDGLSTSGYTILNGNISYRLSPFPTAKGIAIGKNNLVAMTQANNLVLYEFDENTDDFIFLKSIPTVDTPTAVKFSRDGTTLAVLGKTEVVMYSISEELVVTEISRAIGFEYTGSSNAWYAGDITISYDNTYIVTAYSGWSNGPSSIGYRVLYKLIDGTLTMLKRLNGVTRGVAFHPSENLLAVGVGFSNYGTSGNITIYNVENDDCEQIYYLADSYDVVNVDWSTDGLYLLLSGKVANTGWMKLLKRTGSTTFTPIYLNPDIGGQPINGCFIPNTYDIIAANTGAGGTSNQGVIYTATVIDDEISPFSNIGIQRSISLGHGLGQGAIPPQCNENGTLFFNGKDVGASTYSHFARIYEDRRTLKFDTPPAQDVVITATYTVPYIPKSSDYVLDITCTIKFGEGV